MKRGLGLWLLGAVALGHGCGGRATWKPRMPAPAPGDVTITATGEAAGADDAAARQAERRAVRCAVERALDGIIGTGLAGERRRIARDKILSNIGSFVNYHREPGGHKVRDSVTSVTVKAVVKTGAMKDALAEIRRTLDAKRLPRVMAVIGPLGEGEPAEAAALAQRAIEAVLVRRGFRVLEGVSGPVRRRVHEAFGRDDPKDIAAAARSLGAEVVIAGRAARPSDSGEISLSVRAIDTGSELSLFTGERTAVGVTGADALLGIATALAGQCVEAVRKQWGGKGRSLRTVVVRVRGLDFPGFVRLVRVAAGLRGVASARARRAFAEGRGELVVEHAGDPLDLASSFAALRDFTLRVVTAGVARIELEAGQ